MRTALKHLRKDPVLSEIIARVGPFTMQYREPAFETLARSIVSQQLSTKAASTIFGRLIEAAGSPLTPEAILKMRPQSLRKLGLSEQKTVYLKELARHTRDGKVDFATLDTLPDEEIIRNLTQIKGIGVWTVQMFLMFALRRPDVLPVADLGIRSAMRRAWNLEELPTPDEMRRIGAAWSPWSSVACWYLWRSLENDAAL